MKKIAMIFAGQGSQALGMGKDFYDNSEIAKEMFEKAGERIGVNFDELIFKKMICLVKQHILSLQYY